MQTIMVQIANKEWTMEALHFACALARNNNARITLVRFMQVGHPSYLGNKIGNIAPTAQEYRDLREYTATTEDYGIELEVASIQCLSPLDVIVQAAEEIGASVVFAHLPESVIPYWRKFQLWTLERQLMNQQRQLYTLDQPATTTDWVPSISITQGTSTKS